MLGLGKMGKMTPLFASRRDNIVARSYCSCRPEVAGTSMRDMLKMLVAITCFLHSVHRFDERIYHWGLLGLEPQLQLDKE